MGGDTVWAKDGFTNINKLKEKTEKHEKSRKHMDNVISLTLLGRIYICERVSEFRLTVTNNRLIFRYLNRLNVIK